MGCSVSKMEPGEQVPAGLRPVRWRIDEIKRRRRVRKGSISTAELLRPEDLEAAEDEHPMDEPQPVGETPAPEKESSREAEDAIAGSHPAAVMPDTDAVTPASEAMEEVKLQEEAHLPTCDCVKAAAEAAAKKEEAVAAEKEAAEAAEREEAEGRKLGSTVEDDEELPGSPSFRFYFLAAAENTDDESVKAGLIKNDEKLEDTKMENSHARGDSDESSTSGEESELKPSSKKKGKRFKVLKRGPSAVYSLLNVRNCYCNNPAAATVAACESPRLIYGKAA